MGNESLPGAFGQSKEAERLVQAIIMPQLGEEVTEVVVARWLKQVGDPVQQDEPIVEVVTEKVNVDVTSAYAGVLREIVVSEGATTHPHATLAWIEAEGERP